MSQPTISVLVGRALRAPDATLAPLLADRVASRLFDRDATLWGPDAEAEARVRLGWVDAWRQSETLIAEVEALRGQLRARGVDRIVLCGMGGSSLGPEVIARHSGAPLTVLDSTHPAEVEAAATDLGRTAVVVSSKSGSTVETRSHLVAFERAFAAAGIDPASRIIIVTDPASALDTDARAQGYRVFQADPEVGGRFSALTAFGIVPTVLAGVDFAPLLEDAKGASALLRQDTADNPALILATALVSGLPERYLCLTSETEQPGAHLAHWIEQLIAESTGKHGRGLLPIACDAPPAEGAPPTVLTAEIGYAPLDAGDLRLGDFAVHVGAPLGAQLLLWETATAVMGRLIGVDPFNQPDVEAAKVAARALLQDPAAITFGDAADRTRPEGVLDEMRAAVTRRSYVAIQAYVDRSRAPQVQQLRDHLSRLLGVPVAVGFGPRYLHSTGQFHKGGPALGVFLQITDEGLDSAFETHGVAFGGLIHAQARGDRAVLTELGRTVLTLSASDLDSALGMLERVGSADFD